MGKLLQMRLLFEEPEVTVSPNSTSPPSVPITDNLQQENVAVQELTPVALLADVPDAAARQSALDITKSCIVEAPAGSGKTGLLIQRYLKLLAFGDASAPEEVMALTFTRKADAEMRQRVIQQLKASAANTPLPPDVSPFARETRHLARAVLARDQALGWGLLQNPRQLNIRTIDSLCAELAASLPLLAGTGGYYKPTDDPEPFYITAAERTLLHMGGLDDSLTRDLQDLLRLRDAQPADFIALLGDMLKQRDQWGELIPLESGRLTAEALDRDVLPRLTRTLERLIARELRSAADLLGAGLLQAIAQLGHELSVCSSSREGVHPLAVCADLPDAPGTDAADLPQWLCLLDLLLTKDKKGTWRTSFRRQYLGVDANADQQQQLQYLVADAQHRAERFPNLLDVLCRLRLLPSAPYPEEQWQVVKSLCRVLRQALLELQIVFAERRQCDFTEIALTARQLFDAEVATPELLHASVGKLRHLLVDEMQDTSAGQYGLLDRITDGWDGHTQTVFLVGDPKQSIYEFRQARVERFLHTMSGGHLGRIPLQPLRLRANFRSQAALVHEFNQVFGALLPSPEDLARDADSPEVPFVAADPTRARGASPAIRWHAAEQPADAAVGGATAAAATSAAQAHTLRSVVEDFLATWPLRGVAGARAPRVAVLARNRSHLGPIVQEFHQDRGNGPLAFRAVDVEALAERPEILDLLSLTRALLQPADRVAWLAVLRSPLCGLTLADLLLLVGDNPTADRDATLASLVESRASLLSSAGQWQLHQCWPALQQAIADVGRTSLRIHVERTWRSLGGDAPLAAHERSNANRYLQLLDQVEAGAEGPSLSVLMRRLRRLYAAPAAATAAVELMTIHKAKGLEWDLVLVPGLHRGSGRSLHEFLRWLEFDNGDGSADFLLAPIQGKGERSSALSNWLGRYQAAREASEAKRLFYVACTRAREELHLFATVARKADGSLEAPMPTSLLRAAWPVAERVLEQQLAPQPPAAEVLTFPAPNGAASLSLAAAADDDSSGASEPAPESASLRPKLSRLPASFDRTAPFQSQNGARLPYRPASDLPHGAAFSRPEGSFAARAFGNVVHRFLPVLSDRLQRNGDVDALLAELPAWHSRLTTALRGEGLPGSQAHTEADRVLTALQTSLADPAGRWVLSPHIGASNETALAPGLEGVTASLRADRTFLAGAAPSLVQDDTDHLWIIDYKTAELGGRQLGDFLADQKRKYLPQMQAYAAAAGQAGHDLARVRLGLYLPLLPAFVSWPAIGLFPEQ